MARSHAQAPPLTADNPNARPDDVARTIALRALEHSPRTRQQLAELLARRNVPDEVAASVLDRLVEVGLIDDRDFAERWVAERHRYKGLSPTVLRMELRRKGVAEDLISEALTQISGEDEVAAARELAQRRVERMRSLDSQTQRRRLGGYLQRKGYSYAIVSTVLSEVIVD